MMTTPEADAASTATRPSRSRSWIGWLVLVVLVIGGALLALRVADAVSVTSRSGADPESTGAAGSMALAEILRDRGVDVHVTRSRTDAAAAVRADSTLVMTDPYPLSDDAVRDLMGSADDVVLLSSSARMLRLLDIGADAFASTPGLVEASCDLPEFRRVGGIRPGRMFEPAEGVNGCFADADGRAAVLVDERGGSRTVLVDGSRLFGNDRLAENGNAALGLALLGQQDHVVWYVPSFADSDLEAADEATLGELTPPWVTPVIVLLLLAGVTAAIWRGRRFGPLVAETLPVTVRASETMQGRARLTAKAADAGHAADALRDGAARRLARRLGLHDRAPAAAVADAVADRLRVPRGGLQDLLVGPPPADDAALVDLARHLSDVEAAVDAALRDERRAP